MKNVPLSEKNNMSEEEMVLYVWKLYKITKLNRAWLLALLDSILDGEEAFKEKLKRARQVYYLPKVI